MDHSRISQMLTAKICERNFWAIGCCSQTMAEMFLMNYDIFGWLRLSWW